jgi:hypothetical protein
MTHKRILEWALPARAITGSWLIVLAMVVSFTLAAMQPAQAQSSDTWKSIAIIGGSTAAGAYVGHKVAGSTGAWIGAGVGASAGYAIDRRRRENQYYNNQAAYENAAYYDPNSGYYGNAGPYGSSGYGNGRYDGGPYDDAAYPGTPRHQNRNDSGNRPACSQRSPR